MTNVIVAADVFLCVQRIFWNFIRVGTFTACAGIFAMVVVNA